MSTPHDRNDEEAAWRSIVDNYGERPQLDEAEPPSRQTSDPGLADLEVPDDLRDPSDAEVPGSPRGLYRSDPYGDEEERIARRREEDHYVPPAPPPLPRTTPPRLLAWLGLFGVPMFVLLALVAGLALPPWLGLVLMVWFVGGFVFLVASMRPEPRDDYDDGAVL